MKSTREYKHYKDEIKFNRSAVVISQGEIEDRKYNFYTPELILIITTENLEAIDRETKKEVTINGWQFFDSFKEGYEAGVQYFESEYSILPDTLYGKHAELYIKDLHLNYFHIRHSGMKEGWHFVKNSYPLVISTKTIKEWGYYSGIVSQVDQMAHKYPRLFKEFDRCEHQSEQEAPKTLEELFYDPANAEPCLDILKEIQPPSIDSLNNYIGKSKGIFPLWIKVLKNNRPKPLIKHFSDLVYKDILNSKINDLNLSKDASEFRKTYKRLESNKVEVDIKTILSQYSQSGKLGK